MPKEELIRRIDTVSAVAAANSTLGASSGGGGGGGGDHGSLTGLEDDDHLLYLLASDATNRTNFATIWEVLDQATPFFNGSTIEHTDQTISESGGTVYLNFEQNGGGDVQFVFGAAVYTLDCTPIAQVALTAGTDVAPTLNYVYVTEAAGTATLAASTTGWPTAEDYAAVATVLVQSAATVATYGPYKHHAWTDHMQDSQAVGHVNHINAKIRDTDATWIDGYA